MKILIVPSWYPTEDSPINGIFFKEQAQALQKYGYEVIVAYPELKSLRTLGKKNPPSFNISFEIEDGLKTYRLKSYNPIPLRFSVGQASVFYFLLKRLYDRIVSVDGKPAVIHAHACLWAGVAAARLAKKENIPLVITEHSSKFPLNLIKPYEETLINKALKQSEKVIAVGPGLEKKLLQYVEAKSKLTVIPNIVNVKRFINLSKTIENAKFRFFSLGFLNFNKGMDVLIKAFAKGFKDKNAELIIGGDGPEMLNLKSLAYDLGIMSQIQFLGQLNRDQVIHEMQKSDVFVLASRVETFGVVYIEALSCGKPIIATRCGGPEMIVNENNGLLVDVNNIEALSYAMKNIFDNIDNYDPDVIRQDSIKRFGEKSIISRLKVIYQSILDI